MHKFTKIFLVLLLSAFMFPTIVLATLVGGPHLWLSTSPDFDEYTNPDYVGSSSDGWLEDSFVTDAAGFDLFMTYNNPSENPYPAYTGNIFLIAAVHQGETGSLSIDGNAISGFPHTDLSTTNYGGGSHGVYPPSGDAMFAIYDTGFYLDAMEVNSVFVEWSGFSQLHFDAFSADSFYNPPSHDVTGTPDVPVPEPGTLILFGSGLIALVGLRRKFQK